MSRLARWARGFGLTRALCVLLLFALVPLRILDPLPLEEIRLRIFDLYQTLRPRESTSHPVVIVDIDEASLKEIGQWPWPRTMVADLVTRLTQLGVVAIGFDVIFAEPDRMSPSTAATSFRDLDDDTRNKLRNLPSNDEVLAEAIRRSRVVVGQVGSATAVPRSPSDAALQTGFAVKGPDPAPFLVTFAGLLRNVPLIEQAAAGRGVFSIRPERDGIVRRVPIIMRAQGSLAPSLSIELLRVVTNAGAILVRTDAAGVQSVAVPGLQVPTDQNGRFWVHFNGHDPARYVSATDVLQGRVPRERVEGKLVLVGTSATGLLDVKTTPVSAALPGGRGPRSGARKRADTVVVELPQLRDRSRVAGRGAGRPGNHHSRAVITLGAIVIAALIGASWYLYSQRNLLIDFTYPLMSSGLVYLALIFVNYFKEQKQRQQIRAAFGYYLSPALVEQLARSPEKLVLGGEERRMTILFSDVRGFTTISEHYKHDPQGLTRLMNRFLTPLTDAIIERKGTIDKYIGDAIMAFWNAPLDDPQQESNACEAALEMLARAEKLNQEFKHEADRNGGKYMPLNVGIGLNTGPCVVGNMGSDFRFNYSVLGDTVNVASRLEARTKDYRIPVVIGAQTEQQARDKFATMEIDRIQVKGKTEPETVFTVLGRAELHQDARFRELHDLTARMLRSYREQDWPRALETIELCRKPAERFGIGALYDMYAERIEAFRRDPPPVDWNGVYEAESK
jgi:adenylate cyclase